VSTVGGAFCDSFLLSPLQLLVFFGLLHAVALCTFEAIIWLAHHQVSLAAALDCPDGLTNIRRRARAMRFVPVKTEEQQANGIVFRARDLLVRQRTQCVNALRGHLFEYGYVFPQGITPVATLVALVEDPQSCLPESVRVILKLLEDTFTALDGQIPRWMPRSTGARKQTRRRAG
jgi:hypothetical protein